MSSVLKNKSDKEQLEKQTKYKVYLSKNLGGGTFNKINKI